MKSTILRLFSCVMLLLLSINQAVAYDMVPAGKQKTPILLINGTIHTVTGATIENGQLLFDKGTIVAVRKQIEAPAGCQVIDLEGKHVYPGLISSDSSLGHIEINSVNATVDTGELGAFNPNLRAEVAVNPDSESIPVTRANGILTAHIIPRTSGGGLIAGKSAVLNLDGWTFEEMTINAPTGMQISWPRDPQNRDFNVDPRSINNPQKAEENYAKQIERLETFFDDARAFLKAKAARQSDLAVDLRMEAMAPVFTNEIPVFVSANTPRQIRDAVHWANKEQVRIIIVGGSDAWRVSDLLQQNGVPVIIGKVNATTSRRWESYNTKASNVSKLHKAGVQFAIGFSSAPAHQRNLPYEAGKAVAFGLPEEEALKAITIYPAEILGVADSIGSLERGKDATLIVTTGSPLDIRTQVELAFIQGRTVDLSSRHTQLFEKYQERYKQN